MKRAIMVAILTITSLGWVLCQGQGQGTDTLRRHLYPPELIMRNQQELGLDEPQRSYIVGQIQETQSQFTSMQWQLEREVKELSDLLDDPGAAEEELVGQLDRVLDLERQIKRSHLLLAVRIKNRLTDGQRAMLSELREQRVRQGDSPERRQQRRRARPGARDRQPAFR